MATATIGLDKKAIDAIAERVVELLLKKGQNIISITESPNKTWPPNFSPGYPQPYVTC